ncbi:hypothetical protein FACS189485_11730 [Spirochaetia bacterium]|nr:hypothetical protein FACS189485_11730 [Spirochaetia bacterium]
MAVYADNHTTMSRYILFLPLLAALFCVFPATAEAESVVIPPSSNVTGGQARERETPLFPSIYFTDSINAVRNREASKPYWAATETEMKALNQARTDSQSILLNNDILAFYGHPRSRGMGILGRYSIEELDARLTTLAGEYRAVSGGRGVQKAFYIIFSTIQPDARTFRIGEDYLMPYIEYALAHGLLVFLDHQIGKKTPADSLREMLPYLRYPNVHLALDPEWHTEKPNQEIGFVSAAEINEAQRVMEEYIVENNIPGERLLVIHQFNYRMITNRDQVDSSFNRVRLVHCMDGHGSPQLKRDTYASNAQATNIPVKAFKLFYDFNSKPDAPLLTPAQVYALNPRPYVIMYQ